MPHATPDPHHDRLLRCAAPPVPDATPDELDRVWQRVQRETTGSPRPGRRRTRVAAGAVAVLLGTTGVAAATAGGVLFGARTGTSPSNAEDLRLGGPGENLDPGAPDFAAVVAEEIADIEFPDARSRRIAVQAQLPTEPLTGHADGPDGYGYTRTGVVRADGATAAICAWTNAWAAADRAGRTADRDAAAAVLGTAPDWPAVVDIVRTQQDPTEGRYVYLDALVAAVTAGDRRGAGAALRTSWCAEGLLPDFPAGDAAAGRRAGR